MASRFIALLYTLIFHCTFGICQTINIDTPGKSERLTKYIIVEYLNKLENGALQNIHLESIQDNKQLKFSAGDTDNSLVRRTIINDADFEKIWDHLNGYLSSLQKIEDVSSNNNPDYSVQVLFYDRKENKCFSYSFEQKHYLKLRVFYSDLLLWLIDNKSLSTECKRSLEEQVATARKFIFRGELAE